MPNERTKPVSVKLDDNTTIQFETTVPRGEKDISDEKMTLEYEKFSMSIEKIASQTLEPLKKLQAKKVTLKMGLSLGIESGGLTAIDCQRHRQCQYGSDHRVGK